MNRKVIDPGRIEWNEKNGSRLSYRMIFEENPDHEEEPDPVLKPEEEADYLREVLQESKNEWEQKIKEARKEAYQLGVREGKKAGSDEARKEMEKRVTSLEKALKEAHNAWKETHEKLVPGLLDLVFEMTEAVLSVPVENPAIRNHLEEELSSLLHRIDESSRIRLWVSQSDLEIMENRVSEYAAGLPLTVHAEERLSPGEYRLESDREVVISSFKTKLKSFRESLSLPSWSS